MVVLDEGLDGGRCLLVCAVHVEDDGVVRQVRGTDRPAGHQEGLAEDQDEEECEHGPALLSPLYVAPAFYPEFVMSLSDMRHNNRRSQYCLLRFTVYDTLS